MFVVPFAFTAVFTGCEEDAGDKTDAMSSSFDAKANIDATVAVDASIADAGNTSDASTCNCTEDEQCLGNACIPPSLIAISSLLDADYFTITAHGTNMTLHTPVNSGVNNLNISSDGNWIVFDAEPSDSREVYRFAADGTGSAQLLSVYSAYEFDGTTLPLHESDLLSDHEPQVDGTGSTVLWLNVEDDFGCAASSNLSTVTFRTDLDLVDPTALATAPNGTTLVAYNECTGNFGAPYTCDPRSDHRLAVLGTGVGTPLVSGGHILGIGISPDANQAAYVHRAAGINDPSRVWTLPVAGGTPLAVTALATGTEVFSRPRLSNTRIFYVHKQSGANTVESTLFDGTGLITHYTSASAATLTFDVSSDSKVLVVAESSFSGRTISVMGANGGEPHEIYDDSLSYVELTIQ